MTNLLELAIYNNMGHQEAVLRALGSPGVVTSLLWTNSHQFKVPYGNAITLGGSDERDSHFEAISDFVPTLPAATVIGVGDSYSNLDLKPLGFDLLFSDPWCVREPGSIELTNPPDFMIEEAKSPDQLKEFDITSNAGFGSVGTERSYAENLLEDDRYRFFIGRSNSEAVSGVLTFNDGASLGIYTFFTLPEARGRGFGDAIIRAALAESTLLPAATNPSNMSDNIFKRLGFIRVGKRTVWLRRPA